MIPQARKPATQLPLRCLLGATILWVLFFSAPAVTAEVTLSPCFSDHMILQRGMPVAIWGTAEPGEQVSVSFRDQTHRALSDGEGKWRVSLGPLEVGEPSRLTVSASNTLVVEDVLVGEVWLGSGQSNMEYPVGAEIFAGDARLDGMIDAAPYPEIRLLKWNGEWAKATPDTVRQFSALLFSFGHGLQPEMDVPVGLIVTARGSTPSGCWVTPGMLEADKAVLSEAEDFKVDNPPEALKEAHEKAMFKWREQAQSKKEAGQNPPPEPILLDPGNFGDRKCFGVYPLGECYRERVEPFAGYTIRGILWDQGESGTGLPELSQYAVMGALIRGWREAWDNSELPFICVQKPSGAGCAWDYENPTTSMARPFERLGTDARVPSTWGVDDSYLRMMSLPDVWLVPASDLGAGLHPVNKSGYGERAAAVALNRIYGRNNPAMGPVFKGCKVEGSAVRIHFTNAEDGLVARHSSKLQGFVLTDADTNKSHWADARIDGGSVIVSAPEVHTPGSVSYAWAKEHPWANLFGTNRLPTMPFLKEVSDK